MSIFTKPLSKLDTADLQELLTDKSVENARLEFKLLVPDKDETLKKLSSFANTFGGFMVVGAAANSADGRLQELPGVDEVAGYKQKVVDWCFAGASPPLLAEVSDAIPASAGNGKVCYVIYVAESDLTPHFLNGRKGVWVRTDEFSSRFEARLANENELRHLLDRRKLIRERRANLLDRARERFDAYAAKLFTARSGQRTPMGPVLELSVVPRFPGRQLCDQLGLQSFVQKTLSSWRGVTFPLTGSGVISQHESILALDAAGPASILEASVFGMMFYCTTIGDAENPDKQYGIHLYRVVGTTLLFLHHADKMLRLLGYSGSLRIQMRLSGHRDVPWFHGSASMPGIFAKTARRLPSRP